MNKFDEVYQNIIKDIMENGSDDFNQRTGMLTKAKAGVSFSLDLEKDGFPILTLRRQPIKSPIAEQVWFLQGTDDVSFLQRYTKIWDAFLDDDGKLKSSYGYRWRKAFKKDQIDEVVNLLKSDPTSRHGVVITWDPNDDGYFGTQKRNVPCPFTFTVMIISGRLCLHNMVRSNDMILGMPFDVFGFALLQSIIAQEVGVPVGIYTHSISNAHIYENHFEAANELSKREVVHAKIVLELPEKTYARACNADERIVDEIYDKLITQYKPQQAINGLSIAL